MIRQCILAAALAAAVPLAAAADYEEVHDLALDASGVEQLEIEAGAGSLEIRGEPGAERITVAATVVVPDRDEDDARELIADGLELELGVDGRRAKLVADFDAGWWGSGDNPRIDLVVRVPPALAVEVDDGSGAISVTGVNGDLRIDDGSGRIELRDLGGSVEIEDGSGSIDVVGVAGDLRIDDGSGSIDIRTVGGAVTIDDGSGSVDVSDVGGDLLIVDDGSGSLRYSNVRGQVEDRS